MELVLNIRWNLEMYECVFNPFEYFPIHHLYGTVPEYLLESQRV